MKIGLQTWGSDGDIRPFLALAGGLSAAGHEVTLVITSFDNKDYTSYGDEMKFKIHHVGKLSYDEKTILKMMNKLNQSRYSLQQFEIVMNNFFHPLAPEMYDAAQKLCQNNDLIIGHFIHFPLHTAAEKYGKPYATVTLNHSGIYSSYSSLHGVPNLGKWINPVWWKLFYLIVDRSLSPEINKLRKSESMLPAKNVIETIWTSKTLNLIAVSETICQKQPDWPDFHKICGFLNIPDKAENYSMPNDLKAFLESGPPPVYITLGSMISLDTTLEKITSLLVDSALKAGCRAIVQSRWNELPDFPDYPQIYKIRNTPHQFVFPHCAAVVHHGGAGTTHSAIRYGCPSIIIEHFLDQAFFANELKRMGIAPQVLHRRNITAGKLARAIKKVLNSPEMKLKAEEYGKMMKNEDGVKKAVTLIEDFFL